MTPPKDVLPYTASCNPPRRAKRARTSAEASQPSTSQPATASQSSRRPHLLPRDSTSGAAHGPGDSESSDDEDEYDPVAAPAPKRRGRKPGPLSRSARESQRKLNHSRIEKARRTKINEALSTLSTLVNEGERRRAKLSGDIREQVQEKGKASGKGKSEEKEFKLDVLVKAVTYMQELIARVQELENHQCSHCAASTSAAIPVVGKRKRDDVIIDVERDGEAYAGDDENGGKDEDVVETSPRTVPRFPSTQPTPSPRLPPIASWLPHPYVDPSCIAAMSDAVSPKEPKQLPSPPPSGNTHTSLPTSLSTLPALSLPAPARPLMNDLPKKRTAPSSSPEALARRSMSLSAVSPLVSPAWTPEDEHAATMLLQMSSKTTPPTSSSSGSKSPVLPRAIRRSTTGSASVTVQTPSSLLGM
ncbi:hypothetical protein K474DRAFT_1657806 [Panus rudis PR-1116 ss-1]|nr:hypothetical protein K474DRAFT_1657806 [Panus rudis PR-1116 ss-1]